MLLDYFKNYMMDVSLSFKSLQGVTLNDALDILIVAFFAYKVIIWIRDTRTWSLLKGFFFLILASAASYFFKLTTVSWLITNTFSVGLIALIVIFQPELRKALEQLGKGKVSVNLGSAQASANLTPQSANGIIEATLELSEDQTGALIIIEQGVPLGDHEQTGIYLDAVISAQLLVNIFEDKTPLHDGAVLIRNNRIAAAACILPLTEREIGKKLGTRHRAAVGVSEVSDAIAIVVSEETATISVASGGLLRRGFKRDELFTLLNNPQIKRHAFWKGHDDAENAENPEQDAEHGNA